VVFDSLCSRPTSWRDTLWPGQKMATPRHAYSSPVGGPGGGGPAVMTVMVVMMMMMMTDDE
jgi:hypothetical protein